MFDEADTIINEADFLEGWEAMQDVLAADEEWARHLFQGFHGREW